MLVYKTLQILFAPFVILGIVFVCFFVFTPHSHAMVVRGGETYELQQNTVLEDDLYTAAKILTLVGTTTGDVFGAGSYVEQEGDVLSDSLLLGGQVFVPGNVLGDLRVLGGKIYLSGHVKEDVVLGGGNVFIEEGAVIEGDILIFTDYLDIKGATIHGGVKIYARTAEIVDTHIQGDAEVWVRESLALSGTTVLDGTLAYEAPKEAFVSDTATVSGETFFEIREISGGNGDSINIFSLMTYVLMMVLVAVVLVFFFPSFSKKVADRALAPGSGWRIVKGFILVVAWPLVSFVLMVTILGLMPALILLFAYMLVLTVAIALASVIAGVVLAMWMKKGDEGLNPSWASLGAISLTLITLLPLVGWMVRILFVLLAFAILCEFLYESVWLRRKEVSHDIIRNEESTDSKKDEKENDNIKQIEEKNAE